MAYYEVLNNAQVTPLRMHALARLVTRLEAPTRQDLIALLQPTELGAGDELAGDVFRAAINCRLLEEHGETKVVTLTIPATAVESVEDFRKQLQQLVLGAKDENEANYLLSLFTAWYAVQNDNVWMWEPKEYEERFCGQLYPDAGPDERPFNTTKYNGWRTWAAFLGYGWAFPRGRGEVLMPDARKRLETLLPALLPQDGRLVEFGAFIDAVGNFCPELDGGVLFNRCWDASRGSEIRGNRLSLMLSTALRGLHDAGHIVLDRQHDATTNWPLFSADGHLWNDVTHIRLGRGE